MWTDLTCDVSVPQSHRGPPEPSLRVEHGCVAAETAQGLSAGWQGLLLSPTITTTHTRPVLNPLGFPRGLVSSEDKKHKSHNLVPTQLSSVTFLFPPRSPEVGAASPAGGCTLASCEALGTITATAAALHRRNTLERKRLPGSRACGQQTALPCLPSPLANQIKLSG